MRNRTCRYLFFLAAAAVLAGCANRGIGPQGGPKDSVPPMPVKSTPENGTVDFQGRRIEVTFNEYLQLDNIAQNLLMSPPQQTPPDVKVRGKRLLVHFADTLRSNTTYTMDFGNAVCDYNEKNPLHNYSFAFSTGPVIDTMEVYGVVYDAEDLNPLKGIYVGIYDRLEDSVFTTQPFLRVARTDSTGGFRIGNMHAGTYRLYAVDDVSHDYRLTPGEALAFADSTFAPFVRPHMHGDTLEGYEYGPADLTLWLFRPQQQRLYLQRTLREQQHLVQLIFSASPDSLPSFRALRPSEADSTASDSAWIDPTPYMLAHYSSRHDTLSLWLTDSVAIAQDVIYLETRYRRTDSLFRPEWYVDTVRAAWRAPRLTAKAREAQERQRRNRHLDLRSNARKAFELYDTLTVTSSTPLAHIEPDSIHLYERIDSVLRPVAYTIETTDSVPLSFRLVADLQPDRKYELQLDSAALGDVYGVSNLYTVYSLQLKRPEDYSTLRVRLSPFLPQARLQLLTSKDKVVRELPAVEEGAFFQYLKPDTYYLRLYIDRDNNGLWTTGSWDEHRQPEPVYYFPDKIQTKTNWDFEEEWDYTAKPQTESKPKELINAGGKKK